MLDVIDAVELDASSPFAESVSPYTDGHEQVRLRGDSNTYFRLWLLCPVLRRLQVTLSRGWWTRHCKTQDAP